MIRAMRYTTTFGPRQLLLLHHSPDRLPSVFGRARGSSNYSSKGDSFSISDRGHPSVRQTDFYLL